MKSKKVTDEEFIQVCQEANSMHDAAVKLGIAMSTFKRRAQKLGCYKTNQGGKGFHKTRMDGIPLEKILNGEFPDYQTYKLKTRLIISGIKKDCCEICGWHEKPDGAKFTPCELHHKDGNPKNHRLENLIILCPNCHSLTKTYRFRKRDK